MSTKQERHPLDHHCEACQGLHRPVSGLCRWPDPPLEKCPTLPGTHDGPRWRRTAWGKMYGSTYVEMMHSAVGDNYGTKTGEKRGRPSKSRRAIKSLLSIGYDNEGDQ